MSIELLRKKEEGLTNSINQLNLDYETTIERNKKAEQDAINAEAEATKAQNNTERCLKEVSNAQALLNKVNTGLSIAESKVEEKNREFKELESSIATAKNQIDASFALEKIQFNDFKKQGEKEISDLKSIISGLTEEVRVLSSEKNSTEVLLKNIKNQIEDLKIDKTTAEKTLTSILDNIKSRQDSLTSYEQDIKTAKSSLNSLSKSVSDLVVEIKEKGKEKDKLFKESQELKKEIDAINLDKINISKKKEELASAGKQLKEAYDKAGIQYPYES